MITPKLIPMEQLEKASKEQREKALTEQTQATYNRQSRATNEAQMSRAEDRFREGGGIQGDEEYGPHVEAVKRGGGGIRAKRALRAVQQDQKMEKALRQLEKWQPPKIATARESRGRRQSKGTAYGGAAHSGFEQGMQKRTLYKAFGIQVQDRSQPSPLFLQKNIDLQKNMDEYLDVYDEILQKADMDWNNVTDEDFVRLEKINLGRFFGRGKKEDKPKKVSGDRAAAAEKVQSGIRESQRRAGLSSSERLGEDIGPGGRLRKPVTEGRAEKLARGIGRFGSKVRGKVDQRQNIGRKIGEAKDTGIARGRAGVAATKAGVAEGRRRGGAIKDIATTAARSGRDVATSGQVKPKLSGISSGTGSGLIGANKTPQDHTEKFKPKTYDNPEMRRQTKIKDAAAASAPKASFQKPVWGQNMEKAMISLQKISNGDTPKQNKNVAPRPKTPAERKAWQKDYYQNIKHKGRGGNLTGTQRYD